MRICYPFVGDTIGGSHVSSLTLIRNLPEAVVPVVAIQREGMLADHLRQEGVDFLRAPCPDPVPAHGPIPKQMGHMLRVAGPLSRFLRNSRVDIVHTNDLRSHVTWALAARLAGARFIWHQRSPTGSRRFGVYSALAHRVLTVSDFARSRLAPGMRRRAAVVLNPFEPHEPAADRIGARARLLEELGVPVETRVVGFVGNLVSQKRPEVFVRMAGQLVRRTADALVFPMFGEPREPTARTVKELIEREGLRDHCRLMGPRFPVEPAIAGCDVLVAPEVREGFGRTLVEAMLTRTPVVASDDGGHLEIIESGRNGVLARKDDPEAFAEAVQRLLAEPSRARAMADEAYCTAARTFSVERHVEAVVGFYRQLWR